MRSRSAYVSSRSKKSSASSRIRSAIDGSAHPRRDLLRRERRVVLREHPVRRALVHVQPRGLRGDLRDHLHRGRRAADHRDRLAAQVEPALRPGAGVDGGPGEVVEAPDVRPAQLVEHAERGDEDVRGRSPSRRRSRSATRTAGRPRWPRGSPCRTGCGARGRTSPRRGPCSRGSPAGSRTGATSRPSARRRTSRRATGRRTTGRGSGSSPTCRPAGGTSRAGRSPRSPPA